MLVIYYSNISHLGPCIEHKHAKNVIFQVFHHFLEVIAILSIFESSQSKIFPLNLYGTQRPLFGTLKGCFGAH